MATGGGGFSNLGGAQFTITVNTAQFNAGMNQAQQTAQKTTVQIAAAFANNLAGLAIVPRQLAAINQTIMATTQAVVDLTTQMQNMNRSGGGGGQGKGGLFGGLGMQMMVVAQMADDIQYGFSAIVNQMPQLGMALGSALGLGVQGSLALGGALGIVAVGVNQIITHWGTLTDHLNAAWSGGAIEQLEAIRLKAEEATKAFEKLAEAPTKAQAAQVAGMKDLITEGPTGKILEAVLEGVVKNPALREAVTDDDRKRLRRAKEIEDKQPAAAKEIRKEIGDRLDKANRDIASRIIGEATLPGAKGDLARERLKMLARRNPGAFPDAFVQDVDNMSPEGQERVAQKRLEAQGRRQGRKLLEKMQADDKVEFEGIMADAFGNQKEMMRKNQLKERFAAEDRVAGLRDQRAAAVDRLEERRRSNKFTNEDFFNYATAHGKSFGEEKERKELQSIDKKIGDAVRELQAMNRKNQIGVMVD